MLMPVAFTFAHCPLCTAGAGVGVLIAKELGMKSSAIGVWVGAFSVALGLWVWNMIVEKQLNKRAELRASKKFVNKFFKTFINFNFFSFNYLTS